jgi:signal transduction histidine kinase
MKLQTKLLITSALLFCLVTGIQLWVSIYSQRRIIDSVEQDLQNITKTVHFSTSLLSSGNGADRQQLSSFIDELKSNRSVKEVSVVNNQQEIVGSSNPSKIGKHHQIAGNQLIVREQLGNKDKSGFHSQYQVTIPLVKDGQVVGMVHTIIVTSDLRHSLMITGYRTLMIALVSLLLAISLLFFTLHQFNKPIRELSSAARQVADGNYDISLVPGSRDEIGQLATAFNIMARKLREQRQLYDRSKDLEKKALLAEVAATAAHEIRNPLNLINLTVDHLMHSLEAGRGLAPNVLTETFSSLKFEVQHLNRAVSDFLALGRSNQLRKQQLSVRDLLEQCRILIQRQLAEKHVSLNFEGATELVIYADLEQMRLVLLNLLLNAYEAVPEKGIITCAIRPSGTEASVTIEIRDDGPGIAPEDKEKVFDPYFSKRSGGTGLGLALVKRIVEEHGGTIEAGNQSSGGAVFKITLPKGEK